MRYKAAVIGCGRIGSKFDEDLKRKKISSHCGAYTNHPLIDLVAVCDKNKLNLNSCMAKWNVKSGYSDYKAMLEDKSIAFLSICTHPDTHFEIIDYAIKKNIRNIFCEKPLSNNLKDARYLVDKCKNNNIILSVNHTRRWNKIFYDLKNFLLNEEFGDLQHVNFYYTRGIANSGSHLFDIIRFLFGEVSSVSAISSIKDFGEDLTISSTLEMLNGLIINLIGLNGDKYRVFDLEIFGSKSKLLLDTSNKITYYKAASSKRSSEFKELYLDAYPKRVDYDQEVFIDIISNLINSFEKNISSKCSGFDGYKSLELIIASIVSLKEQRTVSLPINENIYNFKI